MKKVCTILVTGIFLNLQLSAQQLELPPAVMQKLEATAASITMPLDAGYKLFPASSNPFQQYDFALKSGQEDMEMRYFILPHDDRDTVSMSPDVLSMRASVSVATNNENAYISMLPLTEQEAASTFGADWGITYLFRPKVEFAAYQHCRLMVLYKERIGTIMVFFLFNDPNNEAIELRYPAVRFEE